MPHILYLGGKLPTRSETFVYREIFGLRNRGVKISTASVHCPERDLGEACLESLANQTVPIYGRGIVALICDASLSALSSPWRAASVLVQAISDSAFGSGVKLAKRPRLIIQCVGSLALAWRLRKYGIDHIHAHMAHVPATIAMYAAKFMDVTWSFTGHAVDIFQEQTLLNQKLKRSSFAVCISYWHQSFYRNRVEISDYRLPVIRCGIDVDSFVPGVGGGGIISVGRLVEKKGFDVLIRAMARLKRRGQDIDTTIVGEGPDLVALDTLRRELNVDVQLLGAKSNEEVQHLLRESSLFVLPSRISHCGDRDGIPVVLMEAMASGCCVVGGDLPAIRELVNDGQTGVLVDPDNPDQLAEVIGRLWSDPQKRKRLADRGRARVIDEFAIEPNLDRLQKAFAGATGTQFISDAGQVSGTRRYCLISPCRDEAQYVRRTLESITSQTVRPALWVIVDDGSTDQTPLILDEFERQFDFIRVVRREDRGRRSVGPGVIDAFYAGLETVDLESFDFVGKVDLDLELPTRYFQVLMERMDADPRIGTCSGKPYYLATHGGSSHDRSRLIREGCGDEMSVGMTKFYRVICFRQIGGFVRQVMWDGIDCHRCRMLGWIACSFNDPDLRFVHLRPMGSSDRSILRGRLRHGYGQYFMGTHLAYMTASALFRMAHRPWVIGGLAMWWGYFISLMQCRPRYDDSAFRAFLRRYQWSCLVHGKARAIRRIKKCRA